MASGKKNLAIGVFDSGLGGLTVVKEIMKQLPNEDVVYFGDTARVPYGTKSRESIIRFSKQNISILLKHNVKMIVVACNSSTSHALPVLRRTFRLPIVGVIVPGARKAVRSTRNRIVGVIATPATIKSSAYEKEITKADPGIKVIAQACPLFVPLVEEGWFDQKVTHEIAQEYLNKLKSWGVDTLILGCTHYPLLKPVIGKVMGSQVALIDSAQEVAQEVARLLVETGLSRTARRTARYRFLVSDEPKHFQKAAKQFLGFDIEHVTRCPV
ncbi:MAG: glutamate racemase [Candidatus Omnitrophota bacterium]|nr:glutamate racemase [Candidatus Omnitrophota bacterium]MDZ4241373.1 glutamate racemase [Candidatus Omnitrophota bacterium]